MIDLGNGRVAFGALGGESGTHLSHAFKKMWL